MTRKRNEINDLLSCPTVPNIDELNKRAQDLETVMEKFRIAHTNYHENLQDEEDIEELKIKRDLPVSRRLIWIL